jgi:selenocysteine-specific elongation factor
VDERVIRETAVTIRAALESYHREHPLRAGMEASELRRAAGPEDLGTEILERLEREGTVVRDGTLVRLRTHRIDLGGREPEARRLLETIAAAEPLPPTVRDLVAAGFSRDLVEACLATGRLVRASPEVVLTPGFARRVEDVARTEAAGPEGLTVSRFREALGTSRKYAVPLLEWLDARGVTRREGDLRRPGGARAGD